MTNEELEEHERKYMEIREKKQEDHEDHVKEFQKQWLHKINHFKTKAYEKVSRQEQEAKLKREQDEQKKIELLEKKQ